ncbi:DUF3717 domain-containing protein [Parvibium lacunae]|uniref:DUF3717 domain-containing protein n=1 Tax=Parvibium lacunae TaxID=1888893 RepID=A0A368L0E2_9BURK|nr:DUF3717 domain-containing protein [Parvibium lacunae]RCS57031.1 DUF3717 domain-containing protein [Parvibium lacunae]
MQITLSMLESAINYWRQQQPAQGEALCRPASLLAKPYALMIYQHQADVALSSMDADTQQAFEIAWQAIQKAPAATVATSHP